MKTKKIWIMILALAMITVACKKDDETNNAQPATLKIMLTDAPAGYDEVNIDIQSVGVEVGGTWYDFNLQVPGIYDLIKLSNGTVALLVQSAAVPAGTISQMRLHLGDSNTIVVNGVKSDLKTPSGQSSGYKVKMNASILAGAAYQVLIDFDASRSIVEQGNGNYLLKPVVYGNLVTNIGQIDGTVVPATGGSVALAYNASDTMSVFINQATGYFLINSLVPGSYNVKITAVAPYRDTTIVNVPVTAGYLTPLHTITLAN
jgi:hypothetical protein